MRGNNGINNIILRQHARFVAVCVLEWPRAGLDLPRPDVALHFAFADNADNDTRTITMRAGNKRAREWLRAYC